MQWKTVEHACRPLAWLLGVADRPYPVLLESSAHSTPLGVYSLLCWDPFLKVTCTRDAVRIQDLRCGGTVETDRDPFRVLSEQFAPYRFDPPGGFDLPFAGGAVGYFSYDLRHRIEKLPDRCEYDLDIPWFTLCFYDRGLVFDHRRGITWWVGPEGVEAEVPEPRDEGGIPPLERVRLESNFSRDEYLAVVRRTREYIAAGDIFQANLSQRFSGPSPAGGLTLYARLRHMNPAPFSAYLGYPGFEVASSSPERFLLVEGDRVTTRPIKGTRPRRAGDEVFNQRMRGELLASPKDHAELAMIVDLERNDLGRVCNYGTVRVVEHAVIEAYQTVFHLVSTVTGELYRPEHDEFSLIKATFPGGSITGAPKIRAMEIIEELEPHARSIYTGSIGYISFHGRMDLSIVIRTMVIQAGRVYVQLGGGIVADSDPVLEYEETLHKGRALFEALNAEEPADIARGTASGR
ncbi:MAG: anthranilate synthase component I family protein [Candidatus Brocadiaceae bacterium]